MNLVFHSIIKDSLKKDSDHIKIMSKMKLIDALKEKAKEVSEYEFLLINKKNIIASINNQIHQEWEESIIFDNDKVDFFVPFAGG